MEKIECDWLCELKKSPIFNMSLSSKELFHSNFIAWVLETYPKQMAEFFSEKLKLSNVDEITEIQREKQNIDISFKLGNTVVLIENKVKSIANIEQLQKYAKLEAKNFGKEYKDIENVKNILLSLKKPTIELDKWEHVSYDTLLDFFKKLKIDDQYHQSLIDDYVRLVQIIKENIINKIDIKKVQLGDLFVKNEENQDSKDLESLRTIKMHDIFLKGLYEDFAFEIKKQLCNEYNVEYTKEPSSNGNISVYHGFTNSSGLVDIKYRVNDNFYIGIQIQGNQYRHFVELFDNSKKDVCNLLKSISDANLWFSFGADIHKDKIYPHESSKKCKLYNQFKGKNSIFKYKYFKIDGIPNDNVIVRVKNDIEHLVKNSEGIKNIYTQVSK
ncbi:PD-(D/E)XK nuclease family protein [Francisella philomiragia]|uniref:PD-(D/E)XK nuclease family protein n=1 Tax=Francisella philomiragia TaxID=28110 RepID=UPI0019056DB2|nr:PD-(D/E)XK nuclease family protein [Francisella philomiragia]MBK2092928.1 PD-(D/E)XK nuclease family protein [Francisella philomiragia]MBK2257334.1 PD-(D/E)XK nuclease family protein [Francisella philomiragia]MBK2270029.1 PD-(D/E)XK nuclease family protein [Francisella philomiragia]MBK2271929.1 PD-(D/E)XK nuclease family protein [Francisella philomiragia]MBK2275748.1 PD-(D/E)XK nuclease family protein [Francisella philomiragia]